MEKDCYRMDSWWTVCRVVVNHSWWERQDEVGQFGHNCRSDVKPDWRINIFILDREQGRLRPMWPEKGVTLVRELCYDMIPRREFDSGSYTGAKCFTDFSNGSSWKWKTWCTGGFTVSLAERCFCKSKWNKLWEALGKWSIMVHMNVLPSDGGKHVLESKDIWDQG